MAGKSEPSAAVSAAQPVLVYVSGGGNSSYQDVRTGGSYQDARAGGGGSYQDGACYQAAKMAVPTAKMVQVNGPEGMAPGSEGIGGVASNSNATVEHVSCTNRHYVTGYCNSSGTPGGNAPMAPGGNGAMAPTSGAVIAPGSNGVMAPGCNGVMTPGSNAVMAPGNVAMTPGSNGIMAPGNVAMTSGSNGLMAVGSNTGMAPGSVGGNMKPTTFYGFQNVVAPPSLSAADRPNYQAAVGHRGVPFVLKQQNRDEFGPPNSNGSFLAVIPNGAGEMVRCDSVRSESSCSSLSSSSEAALAAQPVNNDNSMMNMVPLSGSAVASVARGAVNSGTSDGVTSAAAINCMQLMQPNVSAAVGVPTGWKRLLSNGVVIYV
ncbi:hypothetical protein LSTR_LSTR005232, partial [Laodelphax striatellus]